MVWRMATPEIPWIPAEKNPWHVPVLDVRPVTQSMMSSSKDPLFAQNAISYGQDDGKGFIGQEPPDRQTIPANLVYRRDRLLADGQLFIPQAMEHKWAIYFHDTSIRIIRSWQRHVQVVAKVRQSGDEIVVTEIQGKFIGSEDDASLTIRTLDFLLRSHALGVPYPVPLPSGMESDPYRAAIWCFSMYGNKALIATPHIMPVTVPEKPLRSHSLLHIAVARGDVNEVTRQLSAGVPVDLLAADGLPPIHWALSMQDASMLDLLLAKGSSPDARSSEGATALMTEVQSKDGKHVRYLLEHGADVNAQDARGFTALHRVAEMGKIELVKLLLGKGGRADIAAQGQTARSLAELRGHREIVALL
jgi:hypothetical protein